MPAAQRDDIVPGATYLLGLGDSYERAISNRIEIIVPQQYTCPFAIMVQVQAGPALLYLC